MTRRLLLAVLLIAMPGATGCVERTLSINTEPPGATVVLNDQDVGKSPIKVPFTWYGDYDIIIRKPGYETMKTNHKINAPWYQIPIVDIFSECLVPYTIHDDHCTPTYVLEKAVVPDRKALLENAEELRKEALGS
ncbi:MAG TPA: PEGA domain-containing protein [Phycisphaerae bacterium]|nr:PEGA domain-containing protein [Phycisphaerae bacterium]